MRVLVLSSTFPSVAEPTRGVFVFERIRRLAQRCDLVVVSPVPWFPFNSWVRGSRVDVPFLEHRAGIPVYHPRFLSVPRYAKCLDGLLYCLCLVHFVARLRRRFPFELVDAHFEFPDGVGATLLAKLFRRPVMVTLRGKLVRLAGYRLHRPQLRWMLRRADRILAVSAYLRDLAVRVAVSREPVRVIRNGVDPIMFAPMDRREARRRCGLPEEGTILLTVAGIEAHKGQHVVVASLPALLKEVPRLTYVMVGSGRPGDPYERSVTELASRLGVSRHLALAGSRPHSELRAWFCAADASVLLSRSEGWPNVALESLACGVPVIATRVGGVPEIVRDGTDGILVPYGDADAFCAAVLRALETSWDRPAIAAYARSLGWSDVVERLLDEMKSTVQGARR